MGSDPSLDKEKVKAGILTAGLQVSVYCKVIGLFTKNDKQQNLSPV